MCPPKKNDDIHIVYSCVVWGMISDVLQVPICFHLWVFIVHPATVLCLFFHISVHLCPLVFIATVLVNLLFLSIDTSVLFCFP